MILVIGGAPRCGKTTIARRLALEKNISHLPLDALVHAFERARPDLGIGHLGSDDWSVCGEIEPILLEQLRWMHAQEMSVIVDAYHLRPQALVSLRDEIPLRAVFMGYPRDSVKKRLEIIRRNEKPLDWTRNFDDASMRLYVERFVQASSLFENWCTETNFDFFDVTRDWESASRCAYQTLKYDT